MQNVFFDEPQQAEKISKIAGRIMTDELYKAGLISNYFNYPDRLSIFEIYVLEYQMKKLGEYEFNLGYFNNLERRSGYELKYSTYEEYNRFINDWNTNFSFRNNTRDKFKNGDVGAFPAAVIAAYDLIKISENNMNSQNAKR
jgi:hypothetical protein